uniref:Uncharacterized protein n=1 Tax=Rhipicephalus pulchellus TaxID=72859 RepID=L7LUM4_RHIPC
MTMFSVTCTLLALVIRKAHLPTLKNLAGVTVKEGKKCKLIKEKLVRITTDGAKTEETAELVAFPSSSSLLPFLTPCCTTLYKTMLCFTLSPLFPLHCRTTPHSTSLSTPLLFYTIHDYAIHSFPTSLLYHTIQGYAMLYPLPSFSSSLSHHSALHFPFPPPCYSILYTAMLFTLSPPHCYTILYKAMLCFTLSPPFPLHCHTTLHSTSLSHPLAILYYTWLCYSLFPHLIAILYYTRLCYALPFPSPPVPPHPHFPFPPATHSYGSCKCLYSVAGLSQYLWCIPALVFCMIHVDERKALQLRGKMLCLGIHLSWGTRALN